MNIENSVWVNGYHVYHMNREEDARKHAKNWWFNIRENLQTTVEAYGKDGRLIFMNGREYYVS